MSIGRLGAFIRRLRGDIIAGQSGGLSDAHLLDRWLVQRDQAVFEVLLWRHGPMILSVCRRVLNNEADVEDAFQATFLLLVRKAAAIRQRESLAAWLYQTAYRVALRARQRSGQQNARETTGVEWLSADAPDDMLWRDVRPLLDEEINRLPEKYRVPFIRCYLEGCTNEEAAVEMGCPLGTIHSRLAWARERLRERLTRRGVTLATAGLMAILAHNAASAALPTPLAETTLQAAFAYAAHSTAAGTSAGAVALAKGVLRSMFLTKLKLGAAVLVAMTLCGGAGGVAFYHLAQAAAHPLGGTSAPGAAPQPQPAAPAPTAPTNKVPSEREGVLAFVGTEVKPGENMPAKDKIVAKRWMLAIQEKDKPVPAEERVTVDDPVKGAVYRAWQPEDGLPADRLRVGYVMRTYRKLSEGEVVKKGQLLALVDTELAREELTNKLTKIDVAEWELQTSAATKNEAKSHHDRMVQANNRTPGIYANEEIMSARLTWNRYQLEELAKKAALVSAQREANTANTILKKHEIRARVAGEIKVIHHQEGEAVKHLEPVLEILPLDESK